jgi:hypothetical protein
MKFIVVLLLSLSLLGSAGCAAPTPVEPERRPEFSPWEDPWGYGRDPVMRHWFTPPYFNPYQQ